MNISKDIFDPSTAFTQVVELRDPPAEAAWDGKDKNADGLVPEQVHSKPLLLLYYSQA